MEFNYIGDGIDALIIDNFYSEEQLSKIMDELKFLTKKEILIGPEHLGSADGNATAKSGVFLETVYANWMHSGLIAYPMKNFNKPELRTKMLEFNSMYRILFHCDTRSHLVSYYQDSNFYKPHVDMTVFTILNYFHTEPKKFTGGDIKLFSSTSSKQATIEVKQNRVVIIAGRTFHEVLPIFSEEGEEYTGNGRYCNSIFLTLRGGKPESKNDSN